MSQYSRSSGYAQPTPYATAEPAEVVAATTVVTPRDSVRWGPVIAGLLTSLGTFLLLSTLALAVGLQLPPGASDAEDTGITAGIVTGAIGLVSFFLGGFVAARSAAVGGSLTGALNGFLVWALGIAFVVILAALGVGQLFGTAGSLFDQYRNLGSPAVGVDVGALRDDVRNGALAAFFGLALPALAAAAGGWLGARSDGPVISGGWTRGRT